MGHRPLPQLRLHRTHCAEETTHPKTEQFLVVRAPALPLCARVEYGSVYEISPGLGEFDVVTLGSILLHLRDPFLAIQKAASVARETLVITDLLALSFDQAAATILGKGRLIRFMPDASACSPFETWWGLSPHFIAQAVQVLGFTDIQFSIHRQRYATREMDLYTIVARRGSSVAARYNEEAYNQLIMSHFDYDQYLLTHLPAKRLIKYLGSRLLGSFGLARRTG